jgi:hypothetical protein
LARHSRKFANRNLADTVIEEKMLPVLICRQFPKSCISLNIRSHSKVLPEFTMQTWRDHTRQQLQRGETPISASVTALFRGWEPLILPALVIDKLCTGAERWQAAVRQIQPPKDLADILRARNDCQIATGR